MLDSFQYSFREATWGTSWALEKIYLDPFFGSVADGLFHHDSDQLLIWKYSRSFQEGKGLS